MDREMLIYDVEVAIGYADGTWDSELLEIESHHSWGAEAAAERVMYDLLEERGVKNASFITIVLCNLREE